jgi:molybdopterin-guanine dinucleotide biosynthesis protein B
MKRVHIVGRKNHGKTALILDLIAELSRRGLRLGTIKHSGHAHELDTPGKDSFRQRRAGASPAAVVTRDLMAVYLDCPEKVDLYDRLAPLFVSCDLVLVEGDVDASDVKLEVWREAVGGPCLAAERSDIAAVVTDDRPVVSVPVWPRSDVAQVAGRLLAGVTSHPSEFVDGTRSMTLARSAPLLVLPHRT